MASDAVRYVRVGRSDVPIDGGLAAPRQSDSVARDFQFAVTPAPDARHYALMSDDARERFDRSVDRWNRATLAWVLWAVPVIVLVGAGAPSSFAIAYIFASVPVLAAVAMRRRRT